MAVYAPSEREIHREHGSVFPELRLNHEAKSMPVAEKGSSIHGRFTSSVKTSQDSINLEPPQRHSSVGFAHLAKG